MSNIIPLEYISKITAFKEEAQNEDFYISQVFKSNVGEDYFSTKILKKYPALKNVNRWVTPFWKRKDGERDNWYSMSNVENNTDDFIANCVAMKIKMPLPASDDFHEIHEGMIKCVASFTLHKKYNSLYAGSRLFCSERALRIQESREIMKLIEKNSHKAYNHAIKAYVPKMCEQHYSKEEMDDLRLGMINECNKVMLEALKAEPIREANLIKGLNKDLLLLA